MIIFEKLRYKNFLSTGSQFTEILLNRSPSTLVVGENGSGKSTFVDSLCFVLFNKPFRNINKPQLLNSINRKDCLVEVEFSIGDKRYLIRRGMKPAVFDIFLNDELINQDAAARDYQAYLEDHVLKMNFKAFTQIVVLGAADYTPFMALPAASRREVIENLLDINIFSVMNQILKDRNSELKDTIKSIESDVSVAKTKVELQQKYIKTLEQDNANKKVEVENAIKKSSEEIDQLDSEYATIQQTKRDLYPTIEDKQSVQDSIRRNREDQAELNRRIKQLVKDIAFYQNNDVCNTCNQILDEDHKQDHINRCQSEIDSLNDQIAAIAQLIEPAVARLAEIELVDKRIEELITEEIQISSRKSAAVKYVEKLNEDLTKLSATANIDHEKQELRDLAKSALTITKKKNELVEEKYYYDICGSLLKDSGIKTRIIKQYLPAINKLINKYLSMFDFFVSFELNETFEETIKSRYRDTFSYCSFSEGEKTKINLAILFTWRAISRLKNSSTTNLLICDEILDSSLDTAAVESLINIFGDLQDTNIFVITHSPDNYADKFRSQIAFEKVQNYSKIKV